MSESILENNRSDTESVERKKTFDEKYLEAYQRGLFALDTKEEIESSLPDPRFNGYLELMTYLEKYAQSECESILSELEQTKEIEDLEYLKSELNKSRDRVLLFQSKIEEYLKEKEEKLEPSSQEHTRSLIYFKSQSGNVLFEGDLDSIPKEELEDTKDTFEFLRSGAFSSDETKFKRLNNNEGLKGVYEVKGYQSRIYFYRLKDDVLFVFLCQRKKSNNDNYNFKVIENRAVMAYPLLKELNRVLEDPIEREILLQEGNDITNRIQEKLNGVRRKK